MTARTLALLIACPLAFASGWLGARWAPGSPLVVRPPDLSNLGDLRKAFFDADVVAAGEVVRVQSGIFGPIRAQVCGLTVEALVQRVDFKVWEALSNPPAVDPGETITFYRYEWTPFEGGHFHCSSDRFAVGDTRMIYLVREGGRPDGTLRAWEDFRSSGFHLGGLEAADISLTIADADQQIADLLLSPRRFSSGIRWLGVADAMSLVDHLVGPVGASLRARSLMTVGDSELGLAACRALAERESFETACLEKAIEAGRVFVPGRPSVEELLSRNLGARDRFIAAMEKGDWLRIEQLLPYSKGGTIARLAVLTLHQDRRIRGYACSVLQKHSKYLPAGAECDP